MLPVCERGIFLGRQSFEYMKSVMTLNIDDDGDTSLVPLSFPHGYQYSEIQCLHEGDTLQPHCSYRSSMYRAVDSRDSGR